MAESKNDTFSRWKAEVDAALKDKRYVDWLTECDQTIRRYRDDRRMTAQGIDTGTRKLNTLWANVQTLRPAIYSKVPQPVVQRRFLDRDPVARTASLVLERTLSFQVEIGGFHQAVNKAVLDRLLPGMGACWLRYEPQIEADEVAEENEEVEVQVPQKDIEEEGDGEVYETLAYEKVCVDYVYFKDFLWSQARSWDEVRWVARRSFLSRSEIAERFYKDDLTQANKISLDYTPDRGRRDANESDDRRDQYVKKAAIWEIWNKPDRKVYFIAPGTPDAGVLEEVDDPLHLEGFWPCPEPLFSTQTNDTLVPVPDYHEYKDQAKELDDLTDRIAAITEAVKVAGVYDSSIPELKRLLQQGGDNALIPVASWAAFAEKRGLDGAISLVPMKEIIEVLLRLYEARAQVKADLAEITGMSDIVRGQADAGGAKTATEQRIKGQYASLRLQDRQGEVARYCRDIIRIMAEIISEHFSPDSLMQMSGYAQIVNDEVQKAVEKVPPQAAPQQAMPPQGMMAPQNSAPPLYQGIYASPPPPDPRQMAAQQAEAKAREEFIAAIQLLKDDKLRGFRVDIETDSTIQADAQADKEAAVELVTATLQGLGNAGPIIAQAPELVQPIGQLLMLAFRRFRAGKTIEASLETALDQVEERMSQPRPPSPEQQKLEMEKQQQQAEMQRADIQFQQEQKAKEADWAIEQQRMLAEQEKMRLEMQRDREKHAMEMERLAAERSMMELKRIIDAMNAAADLKKAEVESAAVDQQAEADRAAHDQKMEQMEKEPADA